MAALDPRIEAVRERFGLERDDFWQIPQNRQWVCKHAALEVVATKANVEWSLPQVIQADTANGIAVIVASGKMGERVEWATGEASPKNNKNSYPWAMAEKRAKDRVVLKLVGIHGLVYSEDEADDFKQAQQPAPANAAPAPKPISAAEQKRQLAEIDKDLLDCKSVIDVNKCAKIWAAIMERDNWSRDYREAARPKFQERRDTLTRDQVANDIADTFGGATVVNETLTNTLLAGE